MKTYQSIVRFENIYNPLTMIIETNRKNINMSFTFDQAQTHKLVINLLIRNVSSLDQTLEQGSIQKNITQAIPYQLQVSQNLDIDFEQLKNALLKHQFKISYQSRDILKIKIGFTFFEFKNHQKIPLISLKQTITEIDKKLKEQYQKNSFLEHTIKNMNLQIDLMSRKMEQLNKINQDNINQMAKCRYFFTNMQLRLEKRNQQLHQLKSNTLNLKDMMQPQFQEQNDQSKQKIPANTLTDQMKYTFSQIYKHQHIILSNEKTKAFYKNPQNKFSPGFGLALVNQILLKQGSSIRFRIQQLDCSVQVGMGIRNIITSSEYQLKNHTQIGHGCFLVSCGRSSRSHSHKEHNCVPTDFRYRRGDVIRIQTNENELIFFHEKQKYKFKMKIQLTEKEWQQACFCVLIGSGSSISILQQSK